jgi:hypothetical protein
VAVGEGLLDEWLEVEQPKRVRDGGSGPADARSDLVLSQPEFVGELPIRVCFLHGVEVGTLDVLDERDGQLVSFCHLADDGRDVVQAGHLSCAYPTLAGHELVAIQDLGDQHRLENAVYGDASGQRFEGLLLQALARLIWVSADPRDRDLDQGWSEESGPRVRDPGPYAARAAGVSPEAPVSRLRAVSLGTACSSDGT